MKSYNLVPLTAVLLTVWACPRISLAQGQKGQLAEALADVLEEGGSGRSICRCVCAADGGSAATQKVDFDNIAKEKKCKKLEDTACSWLVPKSPFSPVPYEMEGHLRDCHITVKIDLSKTK
jgi:hypothetical protein